MTTARLRIYAAAFCMDATAYGAGLLLPIRAMQSFDADPLELGLIGTIINVKEEEVTLRIDDQAKVKARFLRSAVSRVLQGSSASSAEAKKG